MSKRHREAVRKQFAKTLEAFSQFAVRDTPEVLAEKVEFAKPQPTDLVLDVACGPGRSRWRWRRESSSRVAST